MSIRRWKIRSNQPDEGGSYCDSHTNACPLAFPDLGAKDEDEDGCVNDDDDDGCDDGDDYDHGRVGPCCTGCRYSSCPPPRQHFLTAPGDQIVQILIGLDLSDHKLSVFKNIQQCNLSQNWCWSTYCYHLLKTFILHPNIVSQPDELVGLVKMMITNFDEYP